MSIQRLAATCALFALPAQAQPPNIVADIAPIHGLAAAVMGDLARPSLLIEPGQSPHNSSLRPSKARDLAQSDLVIWMGPILAPWLEDQIETLAGEVGHIDLLSVNGTVLHDARTLEEIGESGDDHGHDEDHDDDGHEEDHDDHGDHKDHDDKHDDHGHDDHVEKHDEEHDDHGEAHDDHGEAHDDHGEAHDDHGEAHDDHGEAHDHHGEAHDDHGDGHDDHGHHHDGTDPHAWLDPQNAILWTGVIADAVSGLDPENAAVYAANAAQLIAQLQAMSDELTAQLSPFSDTEFLVRHDAYHYFEDHFGLSAHGAVTLSDNAAPSAGQIGALRDHVSNLDNVCVFVERPEDARNVSGVFDGITIQVAVADPLGTDIAPGPGFYPQMMRSLAGNMAACLGGT